jgi:hypothetical protein
LENFSLCPSPKVRDKLPFPYQTILEIIDLHILSSMFLDNKQEDNNSGANGSRNSSQQ